MEQEETEGTEELSLVPLSSLFAKNLTMHPLFTQASSMTHDIIGAAIEAHRDKGPGLLESIYEWCLTKELELRDREVQRQDKVIIRYKEFFTGTRGSPSPQPSPPK